MARLVRPLGTAATIVLAALSAASAAESTGWVQAVVDGDTLAVQIDGRGQVQVRLAGIDAPERYQGFGREAQNNLSALAYGRNVRIGNAMLEGNGRLVATVWAAEPGCGQPNCPKTFDLGLAQVAGGFAWGGREQDSELAGDKRGEYAQAEFMAKARRLGLWLQTNPQPPWAWRNNRPDE